MSVWASKKLSKPKKSKKQLGPAPNDIYKLQDEIKQITEETTLNNKNFTGSHIQSDQNHWASTTDSNAKSSFQHFVNHTQTGNINNISSNILADNIEEEHKNTIKSNNKYGVQKHSQSIECSNIQDAKKTLQSGKAITYKFSKNVTPLEIVNVAKQLGLPTPKIKKVLGSSTVLKKLIDKYVNSVKLSNQSDTYYLKPGTEVTALKCDDQLMPQVKIKMNLDYNKYVTQDNQFRSKFMNELSQKVFKCPYNMVQIVDVREGSVIIIVMCTLIGLAYSGKINIDIYLPRRNRKIHSGERQEFGLEQQVVVIKKGKRYCGTVVGLFVDKVKIKYENETPSFWSSFWNNEEDFFLNDANVYASEPGQEDPDIKGSVHINEKGALIYAM